MTKSIVFLAGLVLLSACAAPNHSRPANKGGYALPGLVQSPVALGGNVDAFAVQFLDSLQSQSFAERREFCGYFFRLGNGQIAATPPRRGTFASCEMPAPLPGQGIFASYHTHGAYGPNYDNEVPSSTDLSSDFEFGINGYVSTPGGRVWRINPSSRDTVQVCGRGCVAVDAGFVPRREATIRPRFSLINLQERGS